MGESNREQARSHRGSMSTSLPKSTQFQCGSELARDKVRRTFQQSQILPNSRAVRSTARKVLPTRSSTSSRVARMKENLGSGHCKRAPWAGVRGVGAGGEECVEWAKAIASRLAPTGVLCRPHYRSQRSSNVGASLLAIRSAGPSSNLRAGRIPAPYDLPRARFCRPVHPLLHAWQSVPEP